MRKEGADHPFPPSTENLLALEDCADRLRVLHEVITALEKASVRVPKAGRLRNAVRIIEQVAEAKTLPTTKREQIRFAEAMTDASELYDIGHILPGRLTSQTAGELARLMKGSLGDVRANREPQRFQSQLWLGTILHRGGYLPQVPPDKGSPAPDFLIEEGTMTYGVEAKRPDNAESAVAAIYDAASQLRDYGVRGAALLDLSVAADIHRLTWLRREDAYEASQRFKGRFMTLARHLGQIAKQDYKTRGSVLHNLVLFCHARTYCWIEGEQSGLARVFVPQMGGWLTQYKNLEYHHTMNIQTKLIIGLQKAGFPFEALREIATVPEGFPPNWKL